jgi:hypothetical protein
MVSQSQEQLFKYLGDVESFKKYVKLLLDHYQIIDGYWFGFVEKQYGLETAVKMNEEIWGRIATRTAKDIKSLFKIEGVGIDKVLNALRYLPWYTITEYWVHREADSLRIEIPHCVPQEIRAKKNIGEYPCKKMHLVIFENFVKEIDDSIHVECAFAPPEKHPEDLWCRWIMKPKRKKTVAQEENVEL